MAVEWYIMQPLLVSGPYILPEHCAPLLFGSDAKCKISVEPNVIITIHAISRDYTV